ncbi:MAG: hypothetical protein JJ900_04845 [Rhodospirillales bacterium]|nr:hypothetical protein [Rhodospirillales bacterium]MBO6786158.1 hypothetical protein [Rhodospirillales bacterium]
MRRVEAFEQNVDRFQTLIDVLQYATERADIGTLEVVEELFRERLESIQKWIEDDIRNHGVLPSETLQEWADCLKRTA